MQQKQMILQVEVMPLHKSRFKKKVSELVVNSYLLISLVVKELKIARVIIKIDKLKVLRLISLFLVWKNALELLMPKEDKLLKANMFHLDKVNLLWSSETHSLQAIK